MRAAAFVLVLSCACAPSEADTADAGGDHSADAAILVDSHAGPTADAATPTGADAAQLEGRNGYPGDFPELTDMGGFGAGEIIQGFGGDTTTDRAGNRSQVSHRPVILLHGNGATATDENFGMTDVRDKLLAAGYSAAEIWAPSYLGQDVSSAEVPTPHRTNIEDVREFVDAVIEYLDVPKVDVIAHSLGCGLINGYMRGLTSTGTFDPANHRIDRIGTVVCLGGALYGTGYGVLFQPEFDIGGVFTSALITWDGVEDPTPYGATSEAQMTAPSTGQIPGNRPFKLATSDDDGSRRIHYVALWANGDIVDSNLPNGCALQGADLNQGFDLPDTMPGVLTAALARHGHLLDDQGVFDALLPYLDL